MSIMVTLYLVHLSLCSTVVLFLCRHKYLFMDVLPAISNNTYRKKPFNTLKLSFFVQLTPFES